MSEETITFESDAEPFLSFLKSIGNRDAVAKVVNGFADSGELFNKLVRVECDDSSAAAGVTTVRFYPSQSFLDLVAASGASERDGDTVKTDC